MATEIHAVPFVFCQEPKRFMVVGESPLDKEGEEYLRRLRQRFALLIEYERIVV